MIETIATVFIKFLKDISQKGSNPWEHRDSGTKKEQHKLSFEIIET